MSGFLDKWVERLTSSEPKRLPSNPQFNQQNQDIRKIKQRLTRDKAGQYFCQSNEFRDTITQLDKDGRTGIADELCVDALLILPRLEDKYIFACRLLNRGRTKEAASLFHQLTQEPLLAHQALSALAKIADQKNDTATAIHLLEQCLAWNYNDSWTHHTLNRLRQNYPQKNPLGTSHYQTASLLKGAMVVGVNYRLFSYLGKGGAATVFHGEMVESHQQVAIKVYHHTQGEIHYQEKALSEARFTAQLKHPHIVTIYDVVPEKGFLVMQYCPEGSLRDRLEKRRLSLEEAFDFTVVLLRTLGDIHQQGFAHLDIKPSNILLDHGLPLLSDFGVASKHHSGKPAGTHTYMAPEHKEGHIAQTSDVYALGLVFYELFSGMKPKGAVSQIQLQLLEPGPQRYVLEHLLQRMLAFKAHERPVDLHLLASEFSLAAALPQTAANGLILLQKINSWGQSVNPPIQINRESHPIIAYLSTLDLKETSSLLTPKEPG
jgi:tRNA A-37 threonylcarbamoyl transferase component Bud32